MRCPFRFKEFNTEAGQQTCVDDCALLMTDPYEYTKACAVAVIAMNVGIQMCEGDCNSFVIENESEVMPDGKEKAVQMRLVRKGVSKIPITG